MMRLLLEFLYVAILKYFIKKCKEKFLFGKPELFFDF